MTEVYDVVGIGLGPFNLGLAALLDDTEATGLFLEQRSEFIWHEGMLIEGTTLEVPFLADLVTLADPTSPYSYLNYLRETGRIYEFYFYEQFQIPRREYDDYLRWVSERLESCVFDRRVESVRWNEHTERFVLTAVDPATGDAHEYHAENVALGIGSQPHVPDELAGHSECDVFHTASYLHRRERCLDADSITVVGSGQSAAEVFLDLLDHQPDGGYRLDWLTRSDGFFPMEYSKLGLQHFTPEYTQYVYDLPQETKDELIPDQDLLYKGIDVTTSAEIYDLLYRRSIGHRDPDVGLFAMTEVSGIEETAGGYRLVCEQTQTEQAFSHESDVVILGTGYERPVPDCLDPLSARIAFDEHGRFEITEDYRLELPGTEGRVFVQNAELHTHGVGTPDLGLGCYRNTRIVNQLLGRERYPADTDTVYQDFSLDQFIEHAPGATVSDASTDDQRSDASTRSASETHTD
ncbi:lysine N(6)-hydroxylase/L-ornithine N(5)-oxygenase family protein [Halocatena salina]|uniref:Lysine N(6)-hydroxylase/L-ornithine N(5)-oxygenase family protein n=1 Tax=Halocatena salina TaxID=2934340 RepID=A0A8T9ZZV3_9EURY|nr:lysine N(6)-hydroxylase/L-ornithine N(5)-oxygenase family protein [Halocatena salina]UPM42009.1 lysine N(6)-hydroxylase/L-ornithine N(5)-oxygenase family protein [Halocatena salina]